MSVPNVPSKDSKADDAMSQYEAALKAAFEQASATAVPSAVNQQQELKSLEDPLNQQSEQAPVAFGLASKTAMAEASIEKNTSLLDEVQQQEKAIDQYEAALKATMETSMAQEAGVTNTTPPTIVFGEEQASEEIVEPTGLDWTSISKDISTRIETAESEIGGPLDAASKGEIVGTVLAGSAVLGTAAINSPLLMGAALGYAGTHVLGGKRGEALAEASKDAIVNAIAFTQASLEEEQGDLSKTGARIVEHLQNEAILKAQEVQKAAEVQARELPGHLVEEGKKLVESEDFQQMPGRTFNAVRTFLGSEEVRKAKESVVQSIKEGIESDEFQAVKDRATRSLKNL
jgi:hypothetical protein